MGHKVFIEKLKNKEKMCICRKVKIGSLLREKCDKTTLTDVWSITSIFSIYDSKNIKTHTSVITVSTILLCVCMCVCVFLLIWLGLPRTGLYLILNTLCNCKQTKLQIIFQSFCKSVNVTLRNHYFHL